MAQVPSSSWKRMLASTPVAVSALLVTLLLARVKLVTSSPLMPLPSLLVMLMRARDTARVLVREMPSPVMFWMTPPLPGVPAPVTVRPPVLPVLVSTMPLAPPLAERRSKVMPPLVMAVLVTRRAAPLVVSLVLVPVTVRPPVLVLLVAVKPPLPEAGSMSMPPLKVMARLPRLLVTVMPRPFSSIAPEKSMSSVASSPFQESTLTVRPLAGPVMVPA